MTAAKRHMGMFVLGVLVAALPAAAQVVKGIAPFQNYGAGSIDTINLVDLNLHLHIPIVANKGRGVPFDYSLDFDSSVWSPVMVNGQLTWEPAARPWGWHATSSGDPGAVTYDTVQETCLSGGQETYWTLYENFVWTDASGVAHRFLVATDTPNNCNSYQSSTWEVAPDGSGYTLFVTNYNHVQIVSSAGVVYNPAPPGSLNGTSPAVEDANGNEITETATSGYRTWTDTLGNTLTETDTAAGPTNVNFQAPGGNANVTIQYTAQTVTSNSLVCESGSQPINYNAGTQELPTAILFPDGSGYHMTYDAAGALTSLGFPTGDVIHYSHAYSTTDDAINCVDGSWYTMQRWTRDGSATWQYSRIPDYASIYALWTSTAAVTGVAADNTVLYSKQGYETERDIFAGSTPVETDVTRYNGNTSDCRDYDPGAYLLAPSQTAVTRTLGAAGSGQTSKVVTSYSEYGLPTEEDDYSFGTNSPGALARRVQTTYANLGNVQDKPAEIVVDSGAGTPVVRQTVFVYDQGSVTSTGAAQHLAVTGSRGNLTEIDQYTSASNSLTQNFTYYDTGAVETASAVNGAQTQYQYGGASCGYAFPTEVLHPDGTSEQYSWNCAGAVPSAVTDANGQSTSIAYDDISTSEWQWRPATVTGPDGTRSTTFAEGWVESSMTFNGGASIDDTLTCYNSDGLPYLQQRRQGPGSQNFETTESFFDALNRLIETAAPAVTGFCTAPSSPAAAKSWQYDGQNRPTQVTDADGGTVTYTYNQNDVLTTLGPAPAGENVKSRRLLEYNALGQIASVCEVTTAAAGGVACGQTNGGTGYFTQYTRDAAGRITQTSETGSGATQTRAMTFDWLGRLQSETNPETGGAAATYTYDADSACATTANDVGSQVARQDVANNVTCYLHDSMSRVTSETHPTVASGFATPPNAYFIYGSGNAVDGQPMQNAAGRLAEAYTQSGGTLESDEGFSYAADGQLSDTYEYTAHAPGYYWVHADHAANGVATDLQSNLSGLPSIAYVLDGEGRWSTVSAGGAPLVTATQYNVFGEPTEVDLESGDTDAYTYDPALGRMTGYTFDVSTGAVQAALHWNQNGTMSQLVSSDNLPGGGGANNQTCGFGYDDLARLTSVNCGTGGWAQTFSLDAFGNVSSSGSQGFSATFDLATNRIEDLGVTYNSDGDVTADPQHSYGWDANQRPTTVDGTSVSFDALGRMVETGQGGVYNQMVYGPDGLTAIDQSGTLSKAEVGLPGGGAAVYNASGLQYYRHADWEGSGRVGSTPDRTVAFDQAFSPYGEVESGANATEREWSQVEDNLGGELYDAQAREYEDVAGRWPSPDPAGLGAFNPADPQSLNRYAYTEGTPLLSTDPSGEFGEEAGVTGALASGVETAAVSVIVYYGVKGLVDLIGGLFGHSAPAIDTARAPATDSVRDYAGVNWNGALQGEVDGMPVGMSIPQATPFNFGGVPSNCDFGACGEGFQGPGELAAGGELALGGVCAATGVCEIAAAVVGAAAVGALVYEGVDAGVQVYQARKRDLQQFDHVWSEVERACARSGKTLDKGHRRRLHDAITGMGYSLPEMIEIGKGMFGCQ